MSLQNRVTPFGTLIAVSARGTLMGNRGCLHDAHRRIRRPFRGIRWIICRLAFRGRQRAVMTPGRYTELFFLDEATALAAGHRPCAECRRERFNHFRALWTTANPELVRRPRPAATELDAVLHRERMAGPEAPRRVSCPVEELPDGVLVTDDEETAYLVLRRHLLRWSPAGYDEPAARPGGLPVRPLTPASVVRTLALGYVPGIHPSAWRALDRRER